MWNKAFWVDAGSRAARTFAQVAIPALPISIFSPIDVWKECLGLAVAATIASLLTSISTWRIGAPGMVAIVPPGMPSTAVEATPTSVSAAPAATADTRTPAHREVKEWPTN
nr:MAG TPA: holin [Caudoviricetes sp.]